MSERSRRLLRWAAATDLTFELLDEPEGRVLAGKCIHCGRRVVVGLDKDTATSATLEHIVPKSHGGSNRLENLAVACPRCNHGKGTRLDHLSRHDPKLQAVITTLTRRRAERRRPPPDWFGSEWGPEPSRG